MSPHLKFSARLSSCTPLTRLRIKGFILSLFKVKSLFNNSADIEFLIRSVKFVEGLCAQSPIVLCSHAP
jgi:hypothetical protein